MIKIDLQKAKEIGHNIRREKRAEEFAPLDQQIILQIPGTDTVAIEEERHAVRDKYSEIQSAIDSATTPDEIKAALGI